MIADDSWVNAFERFRIVLLNKDIGFRGIFSRHPYKIFIISLYYIRRGDHNYAKTFLIKWILLNHLIKKLRIQINALLDRWMVLNFENLSRSFNTKEG